MDAEAASAILDAFARVEANADGILWGSKMVEPGLGVSYMTGKPVVFDDQGIIAIRRWLGVPPGSPTNEDVCKRIAECVNALAGIADPATFIADVRGLLTSVLEGDHDQASSRAERLLDLLDHCSAHEERELDNL